MAYDETNRRLYVDEESDKGGIALWQIMKCLRYYKRDTNGRRNLGMIIKNADINKWAKYKPIRFNASYRNNGHSKLERYDFKGMPTDIENDIVYSLQSTFVPITGAITPDAVGLHEADVEYLRPDGATYPYRVQDFDGYNHLITPTPRVVLPNEGNYNDATWGSGGLSGIEISDILNQDDDEGVDLTSFLADSADDLSYLYPCALLTDKNGNSYITALDYHGSTSVAPSPLRYVDASGEYAFADGSWSLRLQKPIYGKSDTTYPWNAAQDGMKLSICLLHSAQDFGVQPPYVGTSENIISLDYNWVNIADNVAIGATDKIVPLYGALNKTITLTKLDTLDGYFIFNEIVGSAAFNRFTLKLDYSGEFTDTAITVTAKLTVTIYNGATVTKTVDFTPNSNMNVYYIYFEASEFGFTSLSANTIFTYNLELSSSLGTATKTLTYSGRSGINA